LRSLRLRPSTLLLALGTVACDRAAPSDPSSPVYQEALAAFHRGLGAAETGETFLAVAAFERVTELFPAEPAGWANLGLTALQRGELETAADRLERAGRLAPENAAIELAAALVERERGRADAAMRRLRRAAQLDPENPRALYLLAQALEQEARPSSADEALGVIDQILAAHPANLAALLDRARLNANMGDALALGQTIDRVESRTEALAFPAGAALRAVRAAGAARDFPTAVARLAALRGELQAVPAYRSDEDQLQISAGRSELLLARFARLPVPTARSAPADTGLRFEAEDLTFGGDRVAWVAAQWLHDEPPLAVIAADPRTVWISLQPTRAEPHRIFAGRPEGSPSAPALAPLDFNYDFRIDLALAGPGGLRLLRQTDSGTFADETNRAIPAAVARAPYAGVWAVDLDLEGDLDLVLAPIDSAPVLLRNRGDGRFDAQPEFASATGLRDFVWADLDADGDPDATLLDGAGRARLFLNGRSGPARFDPRPLPDTLGPARALAAADLNQDGTIDLILLGADGSLRRLSLENDRWQGEVLARWPAPSPPDGEPARLFIADLDNNGDLDALAAGVDGARVWLGRAPGIERLATSDVRVTGIADLSGDGRLDLLGVTADGRPRLLVNHGARPYFSLSLRPRVADVRGDRRINPFGIGGEIEVRAGLLYQKQVITGPVVAFGLGENSRVDVARILWPNGTVQAEFNLAGTNETILTQQRLKGSCPWVFTDDGKEMRFVTDFLWRTALGLRINAQGRAAVVHGEDWIKIRGDQLAPRDGAYDVRITAELWETHFVDHVALMAVDHPDDTELFVDERFILPAPTPALHATGPLRPVAWARDHAGRDVAAQIRARDERYVDGFRLGSYQGIAEEHFIEIALGADAPSTGPLWLVASGWVYPTDASINVAASQGDHPAPKGIQLEVPDGRGGWTVVNRDLGFPAGKTKTILIDLAGVQGTDPERRLRLGTNMEIYWDEVAWAVGRPDAPVRTHRLLPSVAELRYRGFSQPPRIGRREPELPAYERLATGVPQWRDLVGFYTRFGDVRPLNEAVDDRYVIMNAGDELALRFTAPPPPPRGWTRDFVLIGDGWVKDGDYNTGFSTTVLPLPYHGMADYSRPPGRLEDDPAYRRHPEDWSEFHSRFVTPRAFHRALVPDPAAATAPRP
jgi:tetratricopeptide (TPR) repeat protein